MELKEIILLSLSLVTFFQLRSLRAEECDPKSTIIKHEKKKLCVYKDTKGIKTIGVGYNMQNKDASEVFQNLKIKHDYNKFMKGDVTPSNDPCDCDKVPCLDNDEINVLLDVSLKTAIKDARDLVSFDKLCCPVQNVMVDMSFNLGYPRFSLFKAVLIPLVNRQNWMAAGDDLTVSKWCTQVKTRCTNNVKVLRKGCGCSDPYPQKCDSQASACCGSKETCCKGKVKRALFGGFRIFVFSFQSDERMILMQYRGI